MTDGMITAEEILTAMRRTADRRESAVGDRKDLTAIVTGVQAHCSGLDLESEVLVGVVLDMVRGGAISRQQAGVLCWGIVAGLQLAKDRRAAES